MLRLGTDHRTGTRAPLAGFFVDNVGHSGGFMAVGAAGVVLCVAGLVLAPMRRRAMSR